MPIRLKQHTEDCLVGFVLLFLSGGLSPISRQLRFDTPETLVWLGRIVSLVQLFLLLWAFKFRLKDFFAQISSEKVFSALCFLILSSFLWAESPDQVLQYSRHFLFTAGFSIYLAVRYTVPGLLNVLLSALTVAAVISLVLWLIYPSESWPISTLGQTGELVAGFKGSFTHKNVLASNMLLATIVALFCGILGQIHWALSLLLVFFFGGFVVLSHSATNIFGLVVFGLLLLSATGVLRTSQPNQKQRLFSWMPVLMTVLAFLAFKKSALLLSFLNRSPSLTGRTPLWHLCMDAIKKRPLVGYGFNGFWPHKNQLNGFTEAFRIYDQLNWTPANAHNGFLDMALGLGFVGLMIVVVLIIKLVVLSARLARDTSDQHSMFCSFFGLVFTLFLLYSNIFESFLLNPRTIPTVLLIYLLFRLNRRKLA